MSDQNPAPGWYPAPHANNELRYWDGVQWLEPQAPPAPVAAAEAETIAFPTAPLPADAPTVALPSAGHVTGAYGATGGPGVPTPGGGSSAPTEFPVPTRVSEPTPEKKPKSKKGWIIGGSVAAAVILISSVASAMGGGGNKTDVADEKPAASTATTVDEEPAEEPEPEPDPVVMVAVPDVTGQTATEALATLMAAGLNPPVLTALADPLAKVLSTSPAANTEVEEGTEIALTLEEKPAYTLAQQNAISSAQDYLEYSGFSRTGLIGQLEYEGFSTEEATFGVDNAGADWNAEAAETAQQYLDYSSFSRQGLYDQMAYEGFLPAEIEFGLAAVGY
ncbi:Ltp family lipoprotein [Microbacterium sp. UFMG61]|uniref:Ltp family lipoprotein n=1 Tax=Microbacterium sp. UFMG61 TaxID=2745935 RepID=UPI00188FD6F1|nr:Ltp family lipoprotein [Microbacterium sp. UFMG61]